MTPPPSFARRVTCHRRHIAAPRRATSSRRVAWHGRLGALSAAFGDLPCHGTTASGPKPRSVPDASPMLPFVARA